MAQKSYQIKSTPWVRSIVSRSKKSGELERLRLAFDNMKGFNDRTIEMKMRQVRLKRLFREIEEIRDSRAAAWKRRRAMGRKLKTPQEIRLETMRRAIELGKEYSKLNAVLVERQVNRLEALNSPYPYPKFGYAIGALNTKENAERRQLSVIRQHYGNKISRINLRKMQRRGGLCEGYTSETESLTKSDSELQLMKLKHRIEYGNSMSVMNMSKTSRSSLASKSGRRKNKYLNPQASSKEVINFSPISIASDDEVYMDLASMQVLSSLSNNLDGEPPLGSLSDLEADLVDPLTENGRERARNHWHRIADIVNVPRLTLNEVTAMQSDTTTTFMSAMDESNMYNCRTDSVDPSTKVPATSASSEERKVQVVNFVEAPEMIPVTPVESAESDGSPGRVQNIIQMFELSSRQSNSSSSKDDEYMSSRYSGIFTTRSE